VVGVKTEINAPGIIKENEKVYNSITDDFTKEFAK